MASALYSQRNNSELITMVSLCYKREKRIESQLSKLITAKPIYSDRVISCPAHLLSSAEFSMKICFVHDCAVSIRIVAHLGTEYYLALQSTHHITKSIDKK